MGKLHLHAGLQILFTTPSHTQNFVTIHKFRFCNVSERKLHLPSGMYSEIFSFLPLTQTTAEDCVHSAQNQALIFYTCPNLQNAPFLTKNSHFHRFSRPFHASLRFDKMPRASSNAVASRPCSPMAAESSRSASQACEAEGGDTNSPSNAVEGRRTAPHPTPRGGAV